MSVKRYDFAFSMGFCCTCSASLRAEGLQFASTPFDWAGFANVLQAPKAIASNFEDWFERDLLDLYDVRMMGGFVTRVYRNRKTGIGFVHDFSNAEPFEDEAHFAAVKARYDKRIARFMGSLRAAKSILAVYLESPRYGRTPDSGIEEAQRILRSSLPGAEIDVLYMYEDPEAARWREISQHDGITVVAADYRTFLDGELMHLCRDGELRDCLRRKATMDDPRADAEKARFAAAKKAEREALLGGGSRFNRWLNKNLMQTFRNLEAYLERQKLIPGDRPLWFG